MAYRSPPLNPWGAPVLSVSPIYTYLGFLLCNIMCTFYTPLRYSEFLLLYLWFFLSKVFHVNLCVLVFLFCIVDFWLFSNTGASIVFFFFLIIIFLVLNSKKICAGFKWLTKKKKKSERGRFQRSSNDKNILMEIIEMYCFCNRDSFDQ